MLHAHSFKVATVVWRQGVNASKFKGSSRSVAPDVKKPSTPGQAFIAKHKKEPTEQLRQTFNKHSVSKWLLRCFRWCAILAANSDL